MSVPVTVWLALAVPVSRLVPDFLQVVGIRVPVLYKVRELQVYRFHAVLAGTDVIAVPEKEVHQVKGSDHQRHRRKIDQHDACLQ